MRSQAGIATGYDDADLDRWAARARQWAAGGAPDDLPRIVADGDESVTHRDVFVYFISSAKERNPAAAMALLDKLGMT
jgi:uncharacterized protein YecE (DUF72 family)